MAYWVNKNGKKWLYHKADGKYIKPVDLGFISDDEADIRVSQFNIDNSKNPQAQPKRTMTSVYDEYMKYLVDNDYSPKTINDIPNNVLPFINTVPTVQDLTKEKVRAWEQKLIDWRYKRGPKGVERKLSLDTRMHRMRSIKAFIGWMKTHEIIPAMPCKIEIQEGRRDAGRDVGEFVVPFIEALPQRSKGASICIFYAGMRVSATLAAEGAWFNHERCSIKIPTTHTKNDDALEVFLSTEAMALLPKGKIGPAWDGLTYNDLYYDWRMTRKKLGIVGRMRIHDGRVSSASLVYRETKNLKLMKERFGWRSDKMVLLYAKVSEEEHRQAAAKVRFGGAK